MWCFGARHMLDAGMLVGIGMSSARAHDTTVLLMAGIAVCHRSHGSGDQPHRTSRTTRSCRSNWKVAPALTTGYSVMVPTAPYGSRTRVLK